MDCGIDKHCVMPPHIVPAGKERIVVESCSIGFTMDQFKSIIGHRLINLIITDWWFQSIFFSPIWGKDPILTHIFQMDGLKPPTRSPWGSWFFGSSLFRVFRWIFEVEQRFGWLLTCSTSKAKTPRKTNKCPLKINGWFRGSSYWNIPFLGDDVSFRGCIPKLGPSVIPRTRFWKPNF